MSSSIERSLQQAQYLINSAIPHSLQQAICLISSTIVEALHHFCKRTIHYIGQLQQQALQFVLCNH